MRSCISVTWVLATLFTSLGFVNAQTPSTSVDPGFVKSQGGKFTLDGKPFHYVGTNAYWLQLLNKEDLNKTMHDIAALGIKVVRTWAFNDVTEIPKDGGVWFQLLHPNGTVEINRGENGLVRLDNIVKAAKDNNLHVLFSLTNNWFRNATGTTGGVQPSKRGEITPVDRRNLPRNFLSNDYGGMDVYNRIFLKNATNLFHDPFYTNTDILASFSRYVAEVVKRYANETSLLGWEIANDPRCASSLPAANGCTTQTITKWTASVASVVKENDPNHLVSSGDAGFYCVGCTKVFPQVPTPTTSPLPGQRRRRRRGFLTEADLHKLFTKRAKMGLGVRTSKDKSQLRQVRGSWYAPKDAVRKRQSNSFGPAFDGSFGVDTEDLANIPGVDFNSLQFFPDQNTFGPDGTIDLQNITSVIQNGVDWINLHADTANTFSQPVTVSSFGLLTNESQNTFSPFNATQESNNVTITTTEEEQVQAYDTWFDAANNAGVNIIHYQWGQDNITASPSGPIRPQTTTTTTTSTENTVGMSPDDGYAAFANSSIRGSLAGAANLFAAGSAAGTVKVRPRMDL